MPEESGFEIAQAFVTVSPDTEGFREKLQAALDEAIAGVEANVKVGLDTSELDAKAEDAKATIKELDGTEAKATLTADDEDLKAKTDDAKAKVAEVDKATAKPEIDADNAPLKEKVSDSKEQLGGLGSTKTTPPVDADIDPAKEKIAELQQELARLRLEKQGITLDADASPADIKIAQLQAQIAALSQEKTETEVDANTDPAQEKIAALRAELDALRLRAQGIEIDADASPADMKIAQLEAQIAAARAKIELDAEAAPAKAAIDDLEAQLTALKLKKQGIVLDADVSPAEIKIAELQAQIAALDEEARSVDIGGGGSGGGFSLPGGFMTGIAGALTAIAPGIAGATTGLGMLAGTGALAFGGIFKAVSAAHQAAQNIGLTQAQLAATEFQNAVQIQQAQQSVAQAHLQAAETIRNAEQQNIAALQAVGQAEQQVEESSYGLREAEYTLSQAYVQARQNIINLNDALANQKISVQAAQLAVQQAAYQQKLVDQNAYSTLLDKQQAALAVVQAQQQLKDAQDQETQAQTAANLANSQGVNGSQTVIQAKQGVTQATYAQKDAVLQLQDAQRNLAITEANSAAQIQQSQMALANAEQNVTNTVEEQKLQWASMMSTENQAANQFARDMLRLSPAGRQMVNLILSMSGSLRGLEQAAQTAMAPGMVQWLKGIKDLLPDITFGVKLMGQSISAAFGQFGREMQTKWFQGIFRNLLIEGNQFINTVFPAFARFFQELAIVGSKPGAVSGLANLLAGLGNGLTALVKATGPFVGSLSSVLSSLGGALRPIGTLLGNVVGGIASALAPALRILLPPLTRFVDLFGQTLATALSALAPDLAIIATGLGSMLTAAQPLLPVLGQFIGALAQGLTPFLAAAAKAAGPLITSLVAGLMPIMRALVPILSLAGQVFAQNQSAIVSVFRVVEPLLPPLGNLIALVLRLIDPLLRLAAALDGPISSALSSVLTGIGSVVGAVVGWMGKTSDWAAAWHGFTDDIASAWNTMWANTISPVTNFINAALRGIGAVADTLWHSVLEPFWTGVKQGFSDLVHALGSVWNGLEAVFKTPVNFLINTVYDKGIARLWNDVVGAIGLSSIKLPVISGLAGGGIMPGTDHGHDAYLTPMRPEEGVLTPATVRGIGGPSAVYGLNNMFDPQSNKNPSGGHTPLPMAAKLPLRELRKYTVERGAEHAVGLSGGGIVGDIWGGITGAYHDVTGFLGGALDIGKIIAAIATGNTTAFTNAAGKLIGTKAAGDLGKIMVGIPKALITDLVKSLVGAGGGGAGVAVPGHVSGTVSQWFAAGVKAARVPTSWIPGLEEIAHYESGDNPDAVNNSPAGIAAGTPEGIMQMVMGTFLAHHVPGTSMNIFDPVANIASSSRYILGEYGDPLKTPGLISVSHGGAYTGYDGGGVLPPLPPGMKVPVNMTGQPEAVLTPDESQALKVMAAALVQMTRNGGASGPGAAQPVTANFNYFGTQFPTPEQRAQQMRDLTMTLSGP